MAQGRKTRFACFEHKLRVLKINLKQAILTFYPLPAGNALLKIL